MGAYLPPSDENREKHFYADFDLLQLFMHKGEDLRKLPWDKWSAQDRNVCEYKCQFHHFEQLYKDLVNAESFDIFRMNSCKMPCSYNEYEYAKYAYLGAANMVKWGVPEKVLQNEVQTHCS